MSQQTPAFSLFEHASRIGHAQFPFLQGVSDLAEKRTHVLLYLQDLPNLVRSFAERRKSQYPGNAHIMLVDRLPEFRLASACEGLANSVYATCDIAARFANRASAAARSHPEVSAKFSVICKQVRAGLLDPSLLGGSDKLEPYERVRELRTEWTHYSTIFIALQEDQPLLVARSERRQDDRFHFREKSLFTVQELATWSREAIRVLDDFCLECYRRYVLPISGSASPRPKPNRSA